MQDKIGADLCNHTDEQLYHLNNYELFRLNNSSKGYSCEENDFKPSGPIKL